jgi:hypothetical protein
MAWVVVVASDKVFNKYLLKLSPMKPEFRRGMLYAFNPVGFGSMLPTVRRVEPRQHGVGEETFDGFVRPLWHTRTHVRRIVG